MTDHTPVSEDDNCPNCGAAFGRDEERDGIDKFDADKAEVYRADDGGLYFSVEFACPECDADLLVEDAEGTGPVLA